MSDSGLFAKKCEEVKRRLEERFGERCYIKPHVDIEATTLDDLYFKSLMATLKYGRPYLIDSGSEKGRHRLELDKVSITVLYPTTRPLAPIPRQGVPIVPTSEESIEKYATSLLDEVRLGKYHYAYGGWMAGIQPDEELFEKGIPRGTRFNQWDWSMNHFVIHGFGTNHCAITIGCAEALQRYDWSYKTEAEKGSTECLRQVLLKIKGGKLNLSALFRSWDLVSGSPENLGGLVRVMEKSCDAINERVEMFKSLSDKDLESTIKSITFIPEYEMNEKIELIRNASIIEPGYLYADSDGLHVYEDKLDIAQSWVNLVA